MMTREEREARIKELERDYFFLEMKDFWTERDFERSRKIRKEIKELKEER